MSEHHYAPGLMTPNPLVLAGAASQRTKNVKIALLGPLIPLTNPIRVAEEIAMLDAISGGRTVALFLRGTANEHLTYTTDGVADPNTREITQEGVHLILKAWTEPQPFSWRGKHFSFQHVSVWPRTLQEPHPPVFYSGNSIESVQFAAENHLNLAIGFAPPARVAEHVRHYRACAARAGWEPGNESVLYRARALVTADDDDAAAILQRTPGARPQGAAGAGEGGGNPGAAGYQFFGTPQTIVRQILPYHEAGVGILDIAFSGDGFDRRGTRRAMQAFAEVMPQIRAL
jgi:alkanesulfonate monooxygenase SsuD/methylene tetrahydromethanopterin reductase-like flavin-dependent oxidoreductase (luciferase family)